MSETGMSTSDKRRLLTTLAQLGGGQFKPEDDIIQQGKQLILPEGMGMRKAVAFLSERIAADEETTSFVRKFNYRPWDGGVCTWRALRRAFGMVNMRGTMSFFGPEPPKMIDVPTGPDTHESVPWGTFTLPGLTDTTITPMATQDDELGMVFQLIIEGPRKYRAQIEGIFAVVENELATASIYRGKAFDGQQMPDFLDLSGIDESKVVYAEETLVQLDANVWSVLKHREELAAKGFSLKRSALFYGPYGTGKTLGGHLTAKKATEAGWTYLYVRPGKDDLDAVMQTARLYQPACVFIEDLDTVANPEDASSDSAARLLDIFDGITAKGTQLMVVLTTNHPDRIHKGMLRPGRLDAVIRIAELDTAGVTKLITGSLPAGTLDENIDWELVHAAGEGFLPAYLKEGADRAYRYALSRLGTTEGIRLSTDDLVHAMSGLRPQLELMEGAKESRTPDPVGTALRDAFIEATVQAHNSDYRGAYMERELVQEVERKS